MERSKCEGLLETIKIPQVLLSSDKDRPVRLLVGFKRDILKHLIEDFSANPFSPRESFPIPASGNEFALGGSGVLNAYTPLVPQRWFELAHDYAARGLESVEGQV